MSSNFVGYSWIFFLIFLENFYNIEVKLSREIEKEDVLEVVWFFNNFPVIDNYGWALRFNTIDITMTKGFLGES